jgi:acetolactate synthase small subunit
MLRINVTVEESTHDESLTRMKNVVVVLNDNVLEQIANEIHAQQSVQRIGLLARIIKWFGAIANR